MQVAGQGFFSARISELAERLRVDFALSPVAASEIEFYLHGSDAYEGMPQFWRDVVSACADAGIGIFKTEKEKGREQHEIALAVHADPLQVARDTEQLKSIVAAIAQAHGLRADFSAKPLDDEPGNGLHIHVHLMDAQGCNVFYKDDLRMSEALRHSIGGLLAWLPDCMAVFAPMASSYARFVPGGNAPLTVSWGANNRSVAIRLPMKPHADKHIEHRVAGADADAGDVIAVILAAMHDGLTRRAEPGAQIYGDASLAMYNLPRLPETWEDAWQRMKKSNLIAEYFTS